MFFRLLAKLICEKVYRINAAHIKPNAIMSTVVNPSLYIKIPIIRLIVGEIYCVKPIKDNGNLLAPLAKSSNGMAVTTPAPISKHITSVPSVLKAPTPLICLKVMYAAAIGVSIAASRVNPTIELALTDFLIAPYNPKEIASPKETTESYHIAQFLLLLQLKL